jgi:hypothetical protein
MQHYNHIRGIKRKINCSDFPDSIEEFRSERQYWKTYLYNIDAHVYEAFLYEENINVHTNINYWMKHYNKAVPIHFIIMFHDLVHPKIIDKMLDMQIITIKQYEMCTYTAGYPSNFYFK